MSDLIELDSGETLDVGAYPLPAGVGDDVFNIECMAKAMRVSTVTISKWISDGMPVQQRGGSGQAYELRFSHCYAWRQWRKAQEETARRDMNDRAEQKAMLFLNEEREEGAPSLSPKEVREWSEAELIRNKAAQQRGELVRVDRVQDVLEMLLVTVRNTVMSAPDYLEQEFSLSPKQVDKAERYFDGLLVEMRVQLDKAGLSRGQVVGLMTDRAGAGEG